MTVLINLMAAQINSIAENEDQIDALIDVLRLQLKLSLPHDRRRKINTAFDDHDLRAARALLGAAEQDQAERAGAPHRHRRI